MVKNRSHPHYRDSPGGEGYCPFADLAQRLLSKTMNRRKGGAGVLPAGLSPEDRHKHPPEDFVRQVNALAAAGLDGRELFAAALGEIAPVESCRLPARRDLQGEQVHPWPEDPQTSALYLERLVQDGWNFIVAQTPEFIEGAAPGVGRHLAERLHRGDFSLQAHLDLHGLGVTEARRAFDAFLRESVRASRRMVLVIHGRGLSSPGEPILKNSVRRWLTSGHWRKWVLAFCSARGIDGGAGATYVLLRERRRKRVGRRGSSRPLVGCGKG